MFITQQSNISLCCWFLSSIDTAHHLFFPNVLGCSLCQNIVLVFFCLAEFFEVACKFVIRLKSELSAYRNNCKAPKFASLK